MSYAYNLRSPPIHWTPKEWWAVQAAVTILSIKGMPRSARYVTARSAAALGGCSASVALTALRKLFIAGVLIRRGRNPEMFMVPR